MPLTIKRTNTTSIAANSVLFNGSSQYLTLPASSNWAMTGSFTIESWYYPTADGTIITLGSEATNRIQIRSNLTEIFGGAVNLSYSSPLNQWNHIAVVRGADNIIKIYVNGSLANSVSYSSQVGNSSAAFIGVRSGLVIYFAGYISNTRIVNGTAVYTSNFTPPSAPLTAIANTSLLTCNAPTIVDSSTNNFTITNNGSATVSSLSPTFRASTNNFQFARRTPTVFGKSVSFNGSTQYLTIPDDAALNFDSSNFTIECWVNLSNYTSAQSIFTKRAVAANYTEIQLYVFSNVLRLYASSNGSTYFINGVDTTAGSFISDAWNHIALVRNGTEFAGYINGTKSVFGSSAAALFTNTSVVAIGSDQASSIRSAVNGYISNYRIVKGAAVYTSSFAPSTTPLTAIANTSLLTCNADTIVDSSTNNFTITNNNSATVSSVSPFVASSGGMSLKKVYADPLFGTQRAIFGYGYTTVNVSMTNLVSNTGVVATDTAGVGTARQGLAAAGYGTDKAIFGYGYTTGAVSMTNLVSNTGVVATDTTGVGTSRYYLAAAGYGSDKTIFGYGRVGAGANTAITNLVSNTGVVATDTTGVGTARYGLSAAGYGSDKAIFGYGSNTNGGSNVVSITNLVSNTGVVATNTTGVGTSRYILAASGYGSDKAIFGYGQTTADLSITNLVSNTGVVATDTTGVGTARGSLAAAGYGGDKAIFGYGYTTGVVSMTNLVSNTGVVATDTTGVGTARYGLSAAGYSLT